MSADADKGRSLPKWKWRFWLAVFCCPIHHSLLSMHPLSGTECLYCEKCPGIGIWPCGLFGEFGALAWERRWREEAK